VVDLAKVNCKFVPFDYRDSPVAVEDETDEQIIIRTYSDLRKLGEVFPAIVPFFGKNPQERTAVNDWLNQYENRYKPLLYLPLQ
jgi:hypothetical protein